MQEKFSYGQRMNMMANMHKGGVEAPISQSAMMAKLCKRVSQQELCKPNQECCMGFPCKSPHNHACEGFVNQAQPQQQQPKCTANEFCHACNTNSLVAGKAFSNTRQYVVPPPMNPSLLKIAGGSPEKFCGMIDNSKYGNYGTSMLQPVETFCPGASNARLNGAALDMSWASGTMDAICKSGRQPFTPVRYPKYRA